MKLQNFTVIFIIIVIPIILTLSLYISSGIKTIKYQSLYDDGLLSATHDAVYAYELNSSNDELSENPEIKRSIIKSSVKMFEKSLASSCGISSYSSDEIEEYVPAVVFGMYDGFYMYAPSGLYDSGTGKVTDYAHNLKNYVYYSETLKGKGRNGTDIIITYSLDNYITVSGYFDTKNDEGSYVGYEVKKGYLMDINGSSGAGNKYKGVDILTETIDGEYNIDAIEYYKSAYRFTQWFLENGRLAGIEIDGETPFNIGNGNDPEDEKSAFVQHKRKIIKEKMESVLNSTITAYSNRTWGKTYKMPKISQDDWQKIYANISVTTFFQGKEIGLTNYNGYCVVNCTNSREYVNPNLMYFTDGTGYYHSISCDTIADIDPTKLNGYRIGSFEKKQIDVEVEGEEKTKKEYIYEHNELACYECINGTKSSNKETIYEYINGAGGNIKSAYWTSLARERYDPTKTSKIVGKAEIFFDSNGGQGQDKLEKYNVTYRDGDPNHGYGQQIEFPTSDDLPEREGYEFGGWSTIKNDEGTKVVPEMQIATVDIKYYAIWIKKSYWVELHYNNTPNGDGEYVEKFKDEFNKAITLHMVPPIGAEKPGYIIVGWSESRITREGTYEDDCIKDTPLVKAKEEDNIFYAVWKKVEVEIKFDYNYESKGLIESRRFKIGGFVDFPDISREGYELKGWSKNSSADVTIPNNEEIVESAEVKDTDEGTTYYAIWKIKTYKITFDYNNGTGETKEQIFNWNDPIIFPSGITRKGYKLVGWNTDRNATTGINTEELRAKEVITYYAIWEPIKYTIMYEGNGATEVNMPSSEHIYDQEKRLSKNTYVRTGYLFMGWAETANGAVKYVEETDASGNKRGVKVKNLTETDGAVIKLYAKWQPISYTIVYEGNGATGGETANSTHRYDEPKRLNTNGYTKTGYSFVGWAESASGEVKYTEETDGSGNKRGPEVLNLTTVNGTVIKLYAKWAPNIYKITCDTQSGNGGTTNFYEKYNAGYYSNESATNTITSITRPTRRGYDFKGYYTQVNEGTQVVKASGEIIDNNRLFTSDSTIYARWEKSTYEITYIQNYVTTEDIPYTTLNPKTAKYQDTVTLPQPTRTGYTFKGWSTDRNATTGVNTWKVEDNITLFAIWQLNSYRVVYNGNGATSGSTSSSTHFCHIVSRLNTNGFSKTGYVFSGWAESAGGAVKYTQTNGQGAEVLNLTTVNGGTVNLYAKWTAISYQVEYIKNDSEATGTMSNSSHIFGVPKDLTEVGFSKSGYDFVGWATSANGNKIYDNRQTVVDLTSTQGGVVKLYAKWTPITYTIKYNGNGATSGSTANSTHTFNVAKNLTANGFARTNHTFIGWSTTATGGVVFADKQSVKNLTIIQNDEVNLYAVWYPGPVARPGKQNITFKVSNFSEDSLKFSKGQLSFDITASISEHLADNTDSYVIGIYLAHEDGKYSNVPVTWVLDASNNWKSTQRVALGTTGFGWETGAIWQGDLAVVARGKYINTNITSGGDTYICLNLNLNAAARISGIYTERKVIDLNREKDSQITRGF